MKTSHKRFASIVIAVFFLLMIPFVAMQFSSEINWSVLDFLIAGILLLTAGLLIDFVLRSVKALSKRLTFIIAVLLVLLLVWAELAVGVFGTPFAGS